jgi:hypothetical protein
MKRTTLISVLVGAFTFVAAQALASIVTNQTICPKVGDTVVFAAYDSDWGTGVNHGGPFIGTLMGTTRWKTYCVEAGDYSEAMDFEVNYAVESIGLHTANNTRNYITNAAKWLYYQANHKPSSLANYSDTMPNKYLLQEAIWHAILGGGISGSSLDKAFETTAQTWFNAAVTATGETWNGNQMTSEGSNSDCANSVYVLNIVTSSGTAVQSVLFEIPEPGAFLVWGGLAAASWFGMRVSRRGRRIGTQG